MKRTALLLSLALVLLVLLIYEELAREPVEQNAQPAAGEPADLQSGEKPDWGKGANKIASADSEKVLFRIELPGGAWPEPVWFVSAAVSPDSRLMATGKDNGLVEVWDIPTLKKRCTVDHADKNANTKTHVKYVAFAMGGSVLVTGTEGGLVRLWEMPAGRQLATLDISGLARNRRRLHKLVVNPDGQHLLTGHYATILLWELPTGNQLARFDDYRDEYVTEMALSPDDKYFLTMACDRATNKKNIAAFELPAGKRMPEFAGNPAMCWPVAFSADGKLLATGYRSGEDWSPRVWRMPAGELVSTQVGHSKFRTLEFSPDGRMLLSADSLWKTYLSYVGCDRYFSFMNPARNSTDRYSTGIHRGTFTPDSHYIVAPHRSTIAIIDVFTRQPAIKLDAKGIGLEYLSFTPDGRYLVVMSSRSIMVYEPI